MYDDVVQEGVPDRFAELLRQLDKDHRRKTRMKLDPALRDQILAAVPSLRAFAISLSGNVDRADDLVQETMLRALANIHSFQPGTNMSAWLFTILRNLFRSEYRKRRREVEDTRRLASRKASSRIPISWAGSNSRNSVRRLRNCRTSSAKR